MCVFLSLRITRLGMRLTCLKLIWVLVALPCRLAARCEAGAQLGQRVLESSVLDLCDDAPMRRP